MRNIYIETDNDFRVTKVHRMPFDPNNGMGYTREELEKKGFFVEEIPEAVNRVGRRSIMMYNPDTKSIYYEYVGVPLSDKERADQLENALNWMILMMNPSHGTQPMAVMTFAMDDIAMKSSTPALNEFEKGAAGYLAHQIISGKLEAEQCLMMYPQFADYIKEVLSDNGIQL